MGRKKYYKTKYIGRIASYRVTILKKQCNVSKKGFSLRNYKERKICIKLSKLQFIIVLSLHNTTIISFQFFAMRFKITIQKKDREVRSESSAIARGNMEINNTCRRDIAIDISARR